MMRIYTRAGDLAFSLFTFPDGQPHFKLETYEKEFNAVTVELSVVSGNDLLMACMVGDVLRQSGYTEINLDIRYLMGARMDRAISLFEPFSLAIIARLINSAGFGRVRILDAHSEVSTRLIRNATNILPYAVVDQVRATIGPHAVVCPDKGAMHRTQALAPTADIVYCSKTRDVQTGKLSGFFVDSYTRNLKSGTFNALIIDDICDGGGTFVGLAKELRKVGAQKVFLFVTHGIFSKGLPLEGIDRVFTTDSYCCYATCREFKHTVVLPVSMERMK